MRGYIESMGRKVNMTLRHGGIEHLYWVNALAGNSKLARIAKLRNYKVLVEHPIGQGKSVDIVIDRGDKGMIAVEVETGSSYALENIKKCLNAGFEQVYCACTNYRAYKMISREVKDDRVKIVMVKKLL